MRSLTLSLALLAGWTAAAEEPGAPAPDAPAGADVEAAEAEGVAEGEAAEAEVAVTEAAELEVPDVAALIARIDALEAALQAQGTKVDAQGKAISRNRLALIPKETLTWEVEGYYRTRAHVFHGLFADQFASDGSYLGDARYLTHRAKIRPVANFKDLAKAAFEFDLFGDPQFGASESVWGDNGNLQDTPLFASDPSFTGVNGRPNAPHPKLTRAWIEATLPVGLLRVGRQPSHWGMGLLANSGDGFDDTFGENRFGATYDRAIFATRPLAIAAALTGKEDKEIPLFVAVGVDRLVEDPLFQYYGYKCTEGDTNGDHRCDTNGDGVSDQDHSWVDESRTPDRRRDSWLADQNDDVMEMVYVLMYRGEDVELFKQKGDLTAGAYAVNRKQGETDSNIVILDAYVNASFSGLLFEFEGLTIQGRSSAIALPGAINVGAESPLAKQVDIWGYVGRVGYERPTWKAMVEHGYASGDDNPADARFTARALAPDHNVGLILYEEVLSRVTSELWTDKAFGLWSNGGVYNSRYLFPTGHIYPLDNWEILTGLVLAWPDRPDGAFVRCREGEGCAQSDATASLLGWEVDVGIKHRWHEHLLFSLEGGLARATDRVPLRQAGLNPEGKFFTVQSRLAYEF